MSEMRKTDTPTHVEKPADVAVNGESAAQDKSVSTQRLLSLDAFRGLIMIMLAFKGFGLAAVASIKCNNSPDSPFWTQIKYHFNHTEWAGCSFWDLILPAFMFMVGTAMAYSYAKRKRMGHSYTKMFRHALVRAVVLVLLGVFLKSTQGPATNWIFTNVLAVMGLGYVFVFLLWGRTFRAQIIAAVTILAGTWLLYVLYPTTGIDLETGNPDVSVSKRWAQKHLVDLSPAWHKNADVGHALDVYFLNLFPRNKPFARHPGGYSTFGFVPSMVFMIFGLMSGELLRSKRNQRQKSLLLVAGGVFCLALGYLLDATGVCPIIKRLVTPAFVLWAGGWCFLMLASLYALFDIFKLRRFAFPLVVIGMNSLLVYLMVELIRPWTAKMLQVHSGKNVFDLFGSTYAPMLQATMVGLVFWMICYWLYRQKAFVRI